MENNISPELYILCENIKYLRSITKLSKREMAEKLGIGIKTLSLIEEGIFPQHLRSQMLINIYNNFGILSQDMLFVSLKDKYKK